MFCEIGGFRIGLFKQLGSNDAHFFPQTLASQGLFDSFLFAGLQVERVFLDIFDNVFLLNLAFKAPQCAFEGFTLIQNYFRQSIHLLR